MKPLLALALCVSVTACAPVAIGCVVVGGGSVVASRVIHEDHCDGEGCVYSNAMALVLGAIGVALVLGGGIDLAIRQSE